MHQEVATFLLKVPPLEEIGGKICHIIEQYRAGILEEHTCLTRILTEHSQYIKDYLNRADAIKNQL